MNFIARYEEESGQLVNKEKSCYVVGDKTNVSRCQFIAHITSFIKKSLTIK